MSAHRCWRVAHPAFLWPGGSFRFDRENSDTTPSSSLVRHAEEQGRAADSSRVQECADFEQKFGIAPGTDIDAETDAVLQKVAEQAELRQADTLPMPPPGVRPGSARYQLFRDKAYQSLLYQIDYMKHELRDYHEMKRLEVENLKKEALSATPPP
jgi:hypothetical protein